ncbi:MAG TPA: MBL fold metallo-hydrolase [Candidatus Acidoferrales bacterium]|nr:MBL fold metallo-hydrolase [Candidatus Acidoferrales bacterium]
MREIVGGIFTWPWFSERHGYNFNGHLVRDPAGNLCIDPVAPDAATLDALGQLGVSRIIITNRNHVRAANVVRTRTGAQTLLHSADAAYAREQGAELDGALPVGGKIGALVVIGVPGKSPGEVALHWPERRLLIAGDAVIGHPPGRCSLLPERVMDDPSQLRTSVRRLLDLDFDTLLVGDGESILTGAKEQLHELVASFGPEPPVR